MENLKFKTNINCTGCLAKVTPLLNESTDIEKWNVDLNHKDRILTVQTDSKSLDEIKVLVGKVGFKAEQID